MVRWRSRLGLSSPVVRLSGYFQFSAQLILRVSHLSELVLGLEKLIFDCQFWSSPRVSCLHLFSLVSSCHRLGSPLSGVVPLLSNPLSLKPAMSDRRGVGEWYWWSPIPARVFSAVSYHRPECFFIKVEGDPIVPGRGRRVPPR